MVDLFAARPVSTNHALSVKVWARQVFALPDSVPILVSELRCSEPDCPPVETVVAFMTKDAPPQQFKLHKPLPDVTEADIRALYADQFEALR